MYSIYLIKMTEQSDSTLRHSAGFRSRL